MKTGTCIQGKKALLKAAGMIMVMVIGMFEAAAVILIGVGGVLAKALAVLMAGAAVLLFFLTSFSGWNAAFVILTAAVIFWLPEAAGLVLAGLVFLQRRIADAFCQ